MSERIVFNDDKPLALDFKNINITKKWEYGDWRKKEEMNQNWHKDIGRSWTFW